MRWLEDLWFAVKYRLRCPYPISHRSARKCVASGECGCSNKR